MPKKIYKCILMIKHFVIYKKSQWQNYNNNRLYRFCFGMNRVRSTFARRSIEDNISENTY